LTLESPLNKVFAVPIEVYAIWYNIFQRSDKGFRHKAAGWFKWYNQNIRQNLIFRVKLKNFSSTFSGQWFQPLRGGECHARHFSPKKPGNFDKYDYRNK
jgi:hypothetical protein